MPDAPWRSEPDHRSVHGAPFKTLNPSRNQTRRRPWRRLRPLPLPSAPQPQPPLELVVGARIPCCRLLISPTSSASAPFFSAAHVSDHQLPRVMLLSWEFKGSLVVISAKTRQWDWGVGATIHCEMEGSRLNIKVSIWLMLHGDSIGLGSFLQ